MNHPTNGFDFVSSLNKRSISVTFKSSKGSSSDSSPSFSPSSYCSCFFFFFSSSAFFFSSSSLYCFQVSFWGGVGGFGGSSMTSALSSPFGYSGGGHFFSRGSPKFW